VRVKMTDMYSDMLQAKARADDSRAAYPNDCDDFELKEAHMNLNRTDVGVIVGTRTHEPRIQHLRLVPTLPAACFCFAAHQGEAPGLQSERKTTGLGYS